MQLTEQLFLRSDTFVYMYLQDLNIPKSTKIAKVIISIIITCSLIPGSQIMLKALITPTDYPQPYLCLIFIRY